MSVSVASQESDQPDVTDLKEGHWFTLAQKHWARPTNPRKVKAEVIKTELWEALEKEDFQLRSLLVLESLQLLEKYSFTFPRAILC